MRGKTAILLVICFIISGLWPGAAAGAAEAGVPAVLYREDFSGYQSGAGDFAFGQYYGDGMSLDEYRNFDWQYNIGNAISLNSGKAIPYGGAKIYYSGSRVASQGANGYSVTEFDLYIDRRSVEKSQFLMLLTSDYAPGKWFAALRFQNNNVSVFVDGDSDNYEEICSLEKNKWHHFAITMTCTDENARAVALISSVSVDGAVVYTATTPRSSSVYARLQYYNMLMISSRSNVPIAYIDNLTISWNQKSKYDGKEGLLYSVRCAAELIELYRVMKDAPAYTALKNKYDEGVRLLENGGTAEQAALCAGELDTLAEGLTAEQDTGALALTEIGFSDGKSDCDIMPENGTVTSVTVDNKTDKNIDGMVITAFYKDGVPVNCGVTEGCIFRPGTKKINLDPVAYESDFTEAIIMLWDSIAGLAPLVEKIDMRNHTVCDDIGIYIDNKLYYTDAPACKKVDGRIYVPAENILNLMGAFVEKEDGHYHAERIDGVYMDFAIGSGEMSASGRTVNIAAPYLDKDIIAMVDIESLCAAFGCNYRYDGKTNRLWITSNYTESLNAGVPKAGEITYDKVGMASFLFRISCDSNAQVEAYTRISSKPTYNISESTDRSAYVKWNTPLDSIFLWKKAYDLKYEDGAYVGSFGGLRTASASGDTGVYDVMYRITRDGKTETVLDRQAVRLRNANTTLEDVRYEAESLKLVSTFENISYYLSAPEAVSAVIYYKKSSEGAWAKGYEPVYSETLGQYLGTITGLAPNTTYDVQLILDGRRVESATVTTWNETPRYTTVDAKEYITDSGTMVLQGIKGTEDNWIRITSDSVINGGENNWESVYISDCAYLILDGLTIDGAKRYAVTVSGGSQNIRIQNCDVYGWGRLGVWDEIIHKYKIDLDSVNYDAAFRLNDADNVVIERCYIHDCNARTNTWYGYDHDYVHPAGGSGIFTNMGSGLVVRYNDFIGNSVNRLNDAIEGDRNSYYHAGVGSDADIYGNMFFGGNDDAMELDGGAMNVRVYKNRIEQTYCGISYAPVLVGPVYTFGNLMYNPGDREGDENRPLKQMALKQNETADNRGQQFLFNNTIIAGRAGGVLNTKAVNNVLCADYSVFAISFDHTGDYNLLYGHTSSGGVPSDQFKEHEIYDQFPGFTDAATGNYTLSPKSKAKGAGTRIDNFMSESTPDMGAFAYGESFLPYRPLDVSADKYSVNLKNGQSAIVTVTVGDIPEGLEFSIEKSAQDPWLTVTGDLSGTVNSGESYTFTVTADMELMPREAEIQYHTLYCAVLFRLSNGYSVPVTVRAER